MYKRNIHITESKNITYNGIDIIVGFENNTTTILIPSLKSMGKATCLESDTFNEEFGIQLAYFKAMKNYYRKIYQYDIAEFYSRQIKIMIDYYIN